MCRSIKTLRGSEFPPQTPSGRAEIEAAALQYVRKITGYRAPSKANKEAFDLAVQEIADATQRVLESLTPAHQSQIARVNVAEDRPSSNSAHTRRSRSPKSAPNQSLETATLAP